MATVSLDIMGAGSLGTPLEQFLMVDDIQPGSDPGYQICKTIFTHHALGYKIACNPIKLAMSQPREISIPNSPETMVKDAFLREWKALHIDETIFQTKTLSRVYGVSAVAVGAVDHPTNEPLDYEKMASYRLYFNVFDPLNTAGSLVLNQNPNSPDFLKCTAISASGQPYHFSRTCVIQNESPVYISFTSSTFGFNGRSCYQRALFSLKSYITCQIAAQQLASKAAVIVAKRKAPGSITDKVVGKVTNMLRQWIKDSTNGNVISITPDDSIETLNLTNADAVLTSARNHIIEDIANSVPMPAKMLLEGYAGVLANGTEDFKATMQYIDGMRNDMQQLYDFFDNIVMHRAWSPEFYTRIQAEFPEEYGDKDYRTAFYEWKNSITFEWPSLMMETEDEMSKLEKVRLDSIISLMEKMLPNLDPENSAIIIEWVQSNLNSLKMMFSDPLEINTDTLIAYLREQKEQSVQNSMGGEITEGI